MYAKRIAQLQVAISRYNEAIAAKRALLKTVERAWHAEPWEWQMLTLRRIHSTEELAQLHQKTAESILLHESLVRQTQAEIDELRAARHDNARVNHALKNAPMGDWEQQTLFAD